jgi:hypothetical protein
MKRIEKIKINDIIDNEKKIDVEQMKKITGGLLLEDGCVTGICSQQINTMYCAGGAVCTSGIAGIA